MNKGEHRNKYNEHPAKNRKQNGRRGLETNLSERKFDDKKSVERDQTHKHDTGLRSNCRHNTGNVTPVTVSPIVVIPYVPSKVKILIKKLCYCAFIKDKYKCY